MAIGVAAGQPQNSGILIPEIWSGKTLVKFYERCVAAAICNTDYEGEISAQGDKVIIRDVADVIINDYVKGQTLSTQFPDTEITELLIDKAMYYNVGIDDIDKFQSDIPFLEKWTTDAAQKMKIKQDRRFLGTVYADAAAGNFGATAGKISGAFNLGVTGTPVTITKTNVVEFIIDMGTVLDEQDVPEEDRKLTLPNWMVGMIKKSDLKDASLSGDGTSIMRNGRVGMIDRFEIFGSNLVANVIDGSDRCFYPIANQKSAVTWAAQLTKNEVIKLESTFGHAARGLVVYGHKTLKPEALVRGYVKRG